jgi:hypothetical protein
MIPDSLSLGEFALLLVAWAVFGFIGWIAIGLGGLTVAVPLGLLKTHQCGPMGSYGPTWCWRGVELSRCPNAGRNFSYPASS